MTKERNQTTLFISFVLCSFDISGLKDKKENGPYGINAWLQSKKFRSRIYLFGTSSECGGFFFQTNPIGCPTPIIHKFPAYMFCFNLLFIHRPRQWLAIILTNYYFCGFEISGWRILPVYLSLDACHSNISNLNNLKILFKCVR